LLHMEAMHLDEVSAYLYPNSLNFSNCIPLFSIEIDSNAMITDVIERIYENSHFLDTRYLQYLLTMVYPKNSTCLQ